MRKLLLPFTLLLVPFMVPAQATLQAGLGYDVQGKHPMAELQVGYTLSLYEFPEGKLVSAIGLHAIAGFETQMINTTTFAPQLGMVIHLEQIGATIIPAAGYGYRYVSADHKELNTKSFLTTLQIERWIDPHSSGYLKMSVANGYSALFIGLKFSFIQRHP